ncbi:hypothetical protein [Tenacibaculum amylolyticum]|uniref:hypothetical protein n=1 Tax=Tenacibaculum amylolyticum TaxID=104269 RepID=UPI0038960C49
MKQLIFSLFFIGVSISAQRVKKTIIKDSFLINDALKMEMNITNIPIIVETSKDDKVHVDFELDFLKYSEKEMEEYLKIIALEQFFMEDTFVLKIKSPKKIRKREFYSKDYIKKEFNFFTKSLKKKMKFDLARNSKKDILDMFNKEDVSFFSLDKFQDEVIKKKNYKSFNALFKISIPKKFLKGLKITSKESVINFNNLIFESLNLKLEGGGAKIREVSNSIISINNGHGLFGGVKSSNIDAIGDSWKNLVIGSISNSKISSEGIKIEIGEVDDNIEINNFSSQIYLNFFSKNINIFKCIGDYSRIYLFDSYDLDKFSITGVNSILKNKGKKTQIKSKKIPSLNTNEKLQIKVKNSEVTFLKKSKVE